MLPLFSFSLDFFLLPENNICSFLKDYEILGVSLVADTLFRCVEASRVLSDISIRLEVSMMERRFPI